MLQSLSPRPVEVKVAERQLDPRALVVEEELRKG